MPSLGIVNAGGEPDSMPRTLTPNSSMRVQDDFWICVLEFDGDGRIFSQCVMCSTDFPSTVIDLV